MPARNVKQTLQDVDCLLDKTESKGDRCAKVERIHQRQKQIHCEANRA